MPYRYEGAVRTMTYKALRYPGHAALMKGIRDLGLLDTEPMEVSGCQVAPRDVFIRVVSPRITKSASEDMVVLRVVVSGSSNGSPLEVTFGMIDFRDTADGVSAMTRATGYSPAVTSRLQAVGIIEPGVHTPAEAVPVDRYLNELAERGVRVERSER